MNDALKKFSFAILVVVICVTSAAAQNAQEVEMADVLRRDGKIYTVVIGLLIIVTGLVIFLVRLDRRVKRLERR